MHASCKVCFFNPRVEEEILDLPAGLLARFVRYAERLETFGPDLRMPHSRAMGRGLFELRLRASEGSARVFYCTSSDGRIVMLHQFVKKSANTPRREMEIARLRMKEFQDV
jgi:phage-related protein